MQKVLIRPIHIESLPSSTHYRWMLQPLTLWLQEGNGTEISYMKNF